MSEPVIAFRAPERYHRRLAELAEVTQQRPADVLRSLLDNAEVVPVVRPIAVATLPVENDTASAVREPLIAGSVSK